MGLRSLGSRQTSGEADGNDAQSVELPFSFCLRRLCDGPRRGRSSAELLHELNEINADVGFVRVFWVQGQVLVETELIGESLDVTQFTHSCAVVDRVADRIAGRLAEQFGGQGRGVGALGQTVDAPELIGMYL